MEISEDVRMWWTCMKELIRRKIRRLLRSCGGLPWRHEDCQNLMGTSKTLKTWCRRWIVKWSNILKKGDFKEVTFSKERHSPWRTFCEFLSEKYCDARFCSSKQHVLIFSRKNPLTFVFRGGCRVWPPISTPPIILQNSSFYEGILLIMQRLILFWNTYTMLG